MIAFVILIMRFVSTRLGRHRHRTVSFMLLASLLAGACGARAQAIGPTQGAPDDVTQLRGLVEELQKRVAELEAKQQTPAIARLATAAAVEAQAPAPAQVTPAQLTNDDRAILDYLKGTTINWQWRTS